MEPMAVTPTTGTGSLACRVAYSVLPTVGAAAPIGSATLLLKTSLVGGGGGRDALTVLVAELVAVAVEVAVAVAVTVAEGVSDAALGTAVTEMAMLPLAPP